MALFGSSVCADSSFKDRKGAGGGRRDGGQMLLLSGVLLVMGFVVMGTTLVQLQGMEGSTERTQRDSLMTTVDDLIAGLNQTIQDSIVIGETNKTSFQETLRSAEANLRDNAVRSGVYASVELSMEDTNDLKGLFWRPSRCIGYNPVDSSQGLILGWHEDTFEESIAGAVYDIHVTDGRQSFRSLVYVKIMDCAEVEITSSHTTTGSVIGTVGNATGMRLKGGLAANLTEELDLDNMVEVDLSPTIIEDSVVTTQWQSQFNILELDGAFASVRGSAGVISNNNLEFQLEAPEQMHPDNVMDNVSVSVTGYKTPDEFLDPNLLDLRLRVYESDSSLLPFKSVVVPLTTTNQTHILEIDGPDGEGWTRDQIENALWEFEGQGLATGGHHRIYVDHFGMEGTTTVSQGHRLHIEVDWQTIPDQYVDHELYLRYKVDPFTVDEGFVLQMRDTEDETSTWTEIHNMTDTSTDPGYCDDWDDGWCTITYAGPIDEPIPNRPEFQIVDTVITDNWVPQDEDSLLIDQLVIKSRLEGT